MTSYTRRVDPTTRDVDFDDARGTWFRAESPELALVRAVCSTPKGRRLAKQSFGVAWPSKATANVESVARAAILDALRAYVANGTLRDVDATARSEGEALFYEVTFKGRDGVARSHSGRR